MAAVMTVRVIAWGSVADTTAVTNVESIVVAQSRMLGEIVVTARENTGIESGSRINRDAMRHLQPSSFTDLLELLPGNMSKDPSMGSTNSIQLRETGAVSATGQNTSMSDDYAITSLGTSFLVDGTPVNTDADMGVVPDSSPGSPEHARRSVNRGVDMRTIATDNIESVEIIRGIPSAEYGNLTSGLVKINRIKRPTPFTARLKVDGYSKLFAIGKGFAVGDNRVINIDAGYLDSKIDPRNNLENYKRFTGSARGGFSTSRETFTLRMNCGIDYTGSFDNAKEDPDISLLKVDEYRSRYSRLALTANLDMRFAHLSVVEGIGLNGSVSYVEDIVTRRRQVAPQRASVAPSTLQPGVNDGYYLLSEYIADYRSESKPLAASLRFKADGSALSWFITHKYKGGLEWTVARNYGRGQIYDLSRPLSAAWSTRPRDFRDIPSLHTLSFFLEDFMTIEAGNSSIDFQAGLRTIQLPALDKRYLLARRVYIDPRINAIWNLPRFNMLAHEVAMLIGAGYGLTTRMPTADYLYPQLRYHDIIQLNYYDPVNPVECSRVNLLTYVEDAVNYELRAARNRKWEIRFGGKWRGNSFTVTYFDERMSSGFRYSSEYAPFSYRNYDASGIIAGSLSAPPALEDLPYNDLTVLRGRSRVTNGTRIDKQGVEFQVTTARWKPVATALSISGAWFRSRYSNSQWLYRPVSDVVGNTAVSDRFVGIYNCDEGRLNQQFNTNFMFDTQINKWGLVFTASLQCMWFVKTTLLPDSGHPEAYVSADDGMIHQFTDDDVNDPLLRYLVKHYNPQLYDTQTIPPALYLNFKATKKIGRWLRVSAFVNRIIDWLPDYKSNGLTIRRSSSAYFGMEINLSI